MKNFSLFFKIKCRFYKKYVSLNMNNLLGLLIIVPVVITSIVVSIIENRRFRGITRKEAKQCVGVGWHNLIDILYDAKPRDTHVLQV